MLIFYLSVNAFSQTVVDSSAYNASPQLVDSIKVTGNDITEEFIILRELTFGVGDTVTLKTLNYNEERIFSLGIFNKVELKIEKENGEEYP